MELHLKWQVFRSATLSLQNKTRVPARCCNMYSFESNFLLHCKPTNPYTTYLKTIRTRRILTVPRKFHQSKRQIALLKADRPKEAYLTYLPTDNTQFLLPPERQRGRRKEMGKNARVFIVFVIRCLFFLHTVITDQKIITKTFMLPCR